MEVLQMENKHKNSIKSEHFYEKFIKSCFYYFGK